MTRVPSPPSELPFYYDELPGGMGERPPELERRQQGVEDHVVLENWIEGSASEDQTGEVRVSRYARYVNKTPAEIAAEAVKTPWWYYPETWGFWRIVRWFGYVTLAGMAAGWIWGH